MDNSKHEISRNRNSLYQSDYDTAAEDNDDSSSIYFSFNESSEKIDSSKPVENKENVAESDRIPPLRYNPVPNSSALLRKTLKKQLAESTGTPLRNRNLRVSFISPVEQNIPDPEPENNETSSNDNTIVPDEANSPIDGPNVDEIELITNANDNKEQHEIVRTNDSDKNNNSAIKVEADCSKNVQQNNNRNKNKRLTVSSSYVNRNVRSSIKPMWDSKPLKNKPKLVIVPVNNSVKSNNQPVNLPIRNVVKAANIQARKSIIETKKLILPAKKTNEPGTSGTSTATKLSSKRQTINNAGKNDSMGKAIEKKESIPAAVNKQSITATVNKRKTMTGMRRLTRIRTSLLPTKSTSVQALRRQTKNFLRKSFGSNQTDNRTVTTTTAIPQIVVTNASPEKEVKKPGSAQPTTSNSADATNAATASTAQEKLPEKVKTASTDQTDKNVKNSLQCQICKKMCQTELSLKIHMNFHPSTTAKKTATDSKFLFPPNNAVSAAMSGKCKYCDKQFRVQIALDKHIEFNCEKIPALERKRITMNKVDVRGKIGNSTNGFGNTPTNTEARYRNRPSMINESGESVSSREHSGIFRTPAKMIRCKICNEMFFSCVEYADHCTNNHY